MLGKSMRILTTNGLQLWTPVNRSSLRYASMLSTLISKWRKLYYGADRPRPPSGPDPVIEELLRDFKYRNVHKYLDPVFSKEQYMKHKSHEMLIDKNKRILKLNEKINAGVFKQSDFTSKWPNA